MPSTLLPLDDVTQLFCDFGQHGWSGLIITHKGEVSAFRVSEVFTDLAVEMLKICEAAISNKSLGVALCDEPGGVVLAIEADEKQQHTVILSIYEIERPLAGFEANEEGRCVVSVRIRRQRLVGMLMAELWKAHFSLKQPSFQKGRAGFPHKELMRLNRVWDESDLRPSFLK